MPTCFFVHNILLHFYFLFLEIVVQCLSNREYYVQVTVLLYRMGCLRCSKCIYSYFVLFIAIHNVQFMNLQTAHTLYTEIMKCFPKECLVE